MFQKAGSIIIHILHGDDHLGGGVERRLPHVAHPHLQLVLGLHLAVQLAVGCHDLPRQGVQREQRLRIAADNFKHQLLVVVQIVVKRLDGDYWGGGGRILRYGGVVHGEYGQGDVVVHVQHLHKHFQLGKQRNGTVVLDFMDT